jgi:hypothetical protein
MIERVISGGQTGADQAGWRAAKAAGIQTGGCMPLGYLTECGPRPEFAAMYGAYPHPSSTYPPRTKANIRAADFTLIFVYDKAGPGTKLTINLCREMDKPYVVVLRGSSLIETPGRVAYILGLKAVKILNVAGSREGGNHLVGEWVEGYLAELFLLMAQRNA